MFGPCFVIQYLAYFPQIFDGDEMGGCFTFISFLMSYDCYCSLTLPHRAACNM